VFPISAIIHLTLLLERINALERLRKRAGGSEEVAYWEREDREKIRKVRERVVTGVVATKCGSNLMVYSVTTHIRSSGRMGREKIGSERGRGKGWR